MISALAIIFLVLGVACQFMLTQQKFTAGIEGIVCLVVSIALSIYLWRRSENDDSDRKEAQILLALAGTMMLVHVLQLPGNYKIEQQYYRMLENTQTIEMQQKSENETGHP